MVSARSSVRWVRFAQLPILSHILIAAGGMLILLGIAQALFTLRVGGSPLELLIDLILLGTPGIVLVYTAFWLPVSEIERRYYPRLIAWLLGGVAIMFGFIVLRDLHPGVTVEWSLGTQAIALTIGSIGGLLIGIQEIRAIMRTEQLEDYTMQLEDREQKLERQNEQLDQFASIVSHDLRNPLSVAEGRAELAAEECDSDHLDHVKRAHERMRTLIEDLLTLAREGEAVTDFEPVALGALIEGCWRAVETGEATLVSDIERTVYADESRLKQVFENLIRNALEHGGEGVTVTVGELDDGFYIEDDGSGIPSDERDEVFEAGYSTTDDGTGFGLRIVEQIVDAHGWDVHAMEGNEGGARFEIVGVEFAAE